MSEDSEKKESTTQNVKVAKTEHELLEHLVERNAQLLEENNELLRKLHRNAKLTFWFRLTWYLLIIGFPFALYFYVLEPYFAAFGSSYENFIDGLNELPGLRGIDQLINPPEGQ